MTSAKPSQQWTRMMSDNVVERCCDAFWSQTCEPGQEQDRARKALVSPMQAALAALKPGDKVGDGCVVVPIKTINGIKLMCVETIEWLEDDQPSSDDIVDVLRSIRAALDTGET